MAVVGIVLMAPLTPMQVGAIAAMVTALAVIAGARVGRMYLRSLIVIPVAGAMAMFAPLRYVQAWNVEGIAHAFSVGWPQMLELIVTPWLCVLVMMLFAETCPPEKMLYAIEKLRVPHVLVLLLTFIYRYIDTLRAQVLAMHRAMVSRAPELSRRKQVLLYGNLAGSLLIRSYDRGDRIYAAMLSRGFTGTLPRAKGEPFTASDAVFIAITIIFVLALALYR